MSTDDERRFNDLYDRYYEAIVAYLMRAFDFPKDTARDVAQKVFTKVWSKRHDYRAESQWTYLKTTAYHEGSNWIRDAQAQVRDERLNRAIESAAAMPHRARSPEKRLLERETIARIQKGLKSLPETTRLCMLLNIRGYSDGEIMNMLRLTSNGVRSQLKRGRKKLRKFLEDDNDDTK